MVFDPSAATNEQVTQLGHTHSSTTSNVPTTVLRILTLRCHSKDCTIQIAHPLDDAVEVLELVRARRSPDPTPKNPNGDVVTRDFGLEPRVHHRAAWYEYEQAGTGCSLQAFRRAAAANLLVSFTSL